MIESRALPHNLEAEKAVLGAVLLHDEVLDGLELLAQGDFFRKAHQAIYGAMCRLHETGRRVEMVTLREELGRQGLMEEAGGPAYIAALIDGVPRAANVAHYAAIVIEKSRLRAAIAAGTKMLARAFEAEDRAAEIAADAAEKLYELGVAGLDTDPVSLASLVAPGIETLEQRSAAPNVEVTGVATGFTKLDQMLAGLQPSDLVIIAARTSQGKTALAMNMVRYIGAALTVLVFSLEMSRQQLFMRMLSAEARVDSHHLRIPSALSDGDWGRIAAAMDVLAGLKVFIHDEPGIGVREVRARARQIKAKHSLAAIFVDYVQLMRGRGTFDNRTQEIATISRGLKAVAKEFQVPVVALAQLSRASEGGAYGKGRRRPQLTDLAESSSLENDADTVLLIYRPERKADEEHDPPAEIIIAKARNGPTGTIKVRWNPSFVRFENLGTL